MAQFLDDDHRRFLVQHLVDRDHLAELHHHLDDFRSLHRHLVREIRHRDGFRHVHFTHDRFGRRLERGGLLLMLATTLRTAAPAAVDAATRITARLDAAALRCVVLPVAAALAAGARLLLVARGRSACGCRSRGCRLPGCRASRCFASRTRRLVQRTLGFGRLGRLNRLRCRFRRLHLRLARRVHHFANRARFGFGRGTALGDFFLFGARLFGSHARSVFRFLRSFTLRGAFRCRAFVILLACLRGNRRSGLRRRLLSLLSSRRLGRSRCALLRFFFRALTLGFRSLLARLTLGLFALELFLTRLQLLRLLFQQLGFVTCFFLTTLQFEIFDVRAFGHMIRCIPAFRDGLVAADERALLAHLDLNGASFARRIGLLDLRRMPARQRDLALVGIVRAMRLAQVIEQTRLVRLGQVVVFARFLDARCLQLLEQHASRHFQFRGKLGYVVTRHSFLLMQGPIPCG
ncbi:hypothetical protein QFZ89_001507 [Paraburkholderia youngii]